MYINDVHILAYVFIALIGAFAGLFSGWCNERLPEYKKIFSKEVLLEYKTRLKPNYLLAAISAVIYVALLYNYGIKNSFIENFTLLQYLVLTPMLLSVFVIDKKLTIIPNRLSLTMFEIGLGVCFINGINNFNLAIDSLFRNVSGCRNIYNNKSHWGLNCW